MLLNVINLSGVLVPMRRMGTHSGLRRRPCLFCAIQEFDWMRRIHNCVPMRRMGTR